MVFGGVCVVVVVLASFVFLNYIWLVNVRVQPVQYSESLISNMSCSFSFLVADCEGDVDSAIKIVIVHLDCFVGGQCFLVSFQVVALLHMFCG